MNQVRGVYTILSTPFRADGALDELSLRRLVDATVGMGVSGLTILGVAGEAQKLSINERRIVLDVTMEVVGGRVPVIVGTSHDGTDTTIEASRVAEVAGAAGIMVAPPAFLQPGSALTEHFRRIAGAISIPIVLQDFPPVNGVNLSPHAMVDLIEDVPHITCIKLEDYPTPQRIAQTRALLDQRPVTIVGGIGGVYFLDELHRGSDGTMNGFAFPEILVAVFDAWERGDRQEAALLYYHYLGLLVFEGQPKLGLAIRKELLYRRQLIKSPTLRHPAPSVDSGTSDDLDSVLFFLGMKEPFLNFVPTTDVRKKEF